MALGDKLPVVMGAEKAVAGGVATLDATGKLMEAQKPDYTGEEIPVSKTDGTSLSAALSNKVKISALSGIDLNDVTVDGHYRTNGECTNVPITEGGWEQWTQLLVITGLYSDNTTQIMPIYYTGDVWLRTIKAPGVWTPWRKISIATPPQEYDMSLSEGATGTCKYSMDQFGIVRITGQISLSAATGITYIGTLPEGYRPGSYEVKSTCGWQTGGVNPAPCTCGADPDGRVWVNSYGAAIDAAAIDIRFVNSLS